MFSSKVGASGLEKPQGTFQITLFTRDVARAKPLITFKDKELLMKNTCGSKVRVFFKKKHLAGRGDLIIDANRMQFFSQTVYC